MEFLDRTKTRLRELFKNPEFQDFMFEGVFGSSEDEDGIPYREMCCHELERIEDRLIHLVRSHIHHNVPLNRQMFVSFILENIAENLGGYNNDCMNVKFFAVCNQLYCMVFDVIKDDYRFLF